MSSADVLVVGGSTGGVRTVQALRRAGYANTIALLSDETHLPYDRPPLSKELLGADHSGDPVPLLTAEQVADLDLDLHLGAVAVGLDPEAHTVDVSRGGVVTPMRYGRLVIATGVSARTLPGADEMAGVYVIRTLDDSLALRELVRPGSTAVVVGAGFIGAEFAAAARARGMDVVVVEAQETPLTHALGAQVGAEVGRLHELNGARLLTGRTVADLRHESGAVTGVVLDDDTELRADVVVVGIGATPATAWLDGAGLDLEDGVGCDADLRATGVDDVYAVGDVARWPHPRYPSPIRIEHWTNAGDHAQIVAAHVTGRDRPKPALPYVWSDQYGKRIQIVGRPAAASAVTLLGSIETELVALYADGAGSLVAAVVVDDPRLMLKARRAIEAGTPVEDFVGTHLAPTT